MIGLAITLDPLPLTAFLVMLTSKRGVRKGAAFVFGWLVFLAIVVTITVLATGNNPPEPNTTPSLAALAIRSDGARLGRTAWQRSAGLAADGFRVLFRGRLPVG